MPIKSYLISKSLNFSDIETPPIFLGDQNGRYYYAFAQTDDPPSGGKSVSADELEGLRSEGLPFRQIKQEAERRILNVAPAWRQQNALVDLFMLGQKDNPTIEEQEKVTQAKALLEQVQIIRDRSNEIETSILNGSAVDYQLDTGWNAADAE